MLALSAVLLVLSDTLVDFRFKLAVQERFTRDRITSIYGLLYGAGGAGTVIVQRLATRIVFPRLGASTAAVGHAGAVATVAGALVAMGASASWCSSSPGATRPGTPPSRSAWSGRRPPWC